MFSIRHNNIIDLIKIFSDHTEKIKEVSSTITAYFTTSTSSNGSGFLYRYKQQNYILTATHIILDNNNNLAQNVYATYYKNGKTYIKNIPSSKIYYNIQFDIAILELEDNELEIIGIPFGNNRNIKIGEPVISVGNPLSNDPHSYSFGVIRDNNYIYQYSNNAYETVLVDASTYSGNSGGMLLSIDNDKNIYIIGMLQFGFIHSAEIDGVSNIVRVPAESFGGGLSAKKMEFIIEKALESKIPGHFIFPTLLINTRPITNSWLISNLNTYNKIDGCYLTNNYDNDLKINTVIEKIDDNPLGTQLGGKNLLSILLELYYSNQTNVKIELGDGRTVYKNIKNLFNSNQATILNNNNQNKNDIQNKVDIWNKDNIKTNINSEFKFIFKNKDHYLL